MTDHIVTITPAPFTVPDGSVPYVFDAWCNCGWAYPRNAYKWTALAVQDHYVGWSLTNGHGLLAKPIQPT